MNGTIDIDMAIDNAATDYPALAQLLAGYYHQDWQRGSRHARCRAARVRATTRRRTRSRPLRATSTASSTWGSTTPR